MKHWLCRLSLSLSLSLVLVGVLAAADLMVVPVPLAQAQLSAGRVKVLGALGAQRVAAFPDTPTLAEQGFGGYAWDTWLALVAPPGVPPATLMRSLV